MAHMYYLSKYKVFIPHLACQSICSLAEEEIRNGSFPACYLSMPSGCQWILILTMKKPDILHFYVSGPDQDLHTIVIKTFIGSYSPHPLRPIAHMSKCQMSAKKG